MSEALRIEQKYSRYRKDNIVWIINNSHGEAVHVDSETVHLLNFADQCYKLSDGLFDITSGVLRLAWSFDGSSRLPQTKDLQRLLKHVGWHKLDWNPPILCMPDGMQLDLGGLGKEYAVDRTISLLKNETDAAILVNYGGDLHASSAPVCRDFWSVGIEAIQNENAEFNNISLKKGALTTSGNARRYVLSEGIRYGHVLDPYTGWPSPQSPSSVTVAANTCIEAGILSTLAMLKGVDAEIFLDDEGVTYWCQRE
ncbi:MAG: FAD:protein FMN transferase [Granulosicoccus sp.]|nr:FAD:protein FMN transferase [Granulosicoccus sp.]